MATIIKNWFRTFLANRAELQQRRLEMKCYLNNLEILENGGTL